MSYEAYLAEKKDSAALASAAQLAEARSFDQSSSAKFEFSPQQLKFKSLTLPQSLRLLENMHTSDVLQRVLGSDLKEALDRLKSAMKSMTPEQKGVAAACIAEFAAMHGRRLKSLTLWHCGKEEKDNIPSIGSGKGRRPVPWAEFEPGWVASAKKRTAGEVKNMFDTLVCQCTEDKEVAFAKYPISRHYVNKEGWAHLGAMLSVLP